MTGYLRYVPRFWFQTTNVGKEALPEKIAIRPRFWVLFSHDSPFDRLVRPDALRATGRLRAALSFLRDLFA